MVVALSLVAAGCSSIERSRSLSNPATPAKTIAQQVCSNCHGLDGNSQSANFPKLAQQTQPYLIAQLRAFRSHGRSDPPGYEYMWGITRSLTDDQIKGLAEYFSSQRSSPNGRGNTALASEGKEIYDNGVPSANIPACASCHGSAAQGNETFPRLADQYADYVMKQLLVFQRTDERPEGAVMKDIAHSLTPRNIEAIAAYVEGISSK
jgi:cbb3-type cytochrome c oxidase subunit III